MKKLLTLLLAMLMLVGLCACNPDNGQEDENKTPTTTAPTESSEPTDPSAPSFGVSGGFGEKPF